MPREEFISWAAFYELHPFDDESRYFRPAALIATSMSGASLDDLLAWLRRDRPKEGLGNADMQSIKTHGLKPPPGWSLKKPNDEREAA